jgi:hypothetical protein
VCSIHAPVPRRCGPPEIAPAVRPARWVQHAPSAGFTRPPRASAGAPHTPPRTTCTGAGRARRHCACRWRRHRRRQRARESGRGNHPGASETRPTSGTSLSRCAPPCPRSRTPARTPPAPERTAGAPSPSPALPEDNIRLLGAAAVRTTPASCAASLSARWECGTSPQACRANPTWNCSSKARTSACSSRTLLSAALCIRRRARSRLAACVLRRSESSCGDDGCKAVVAVP